MRRIVLILLLALNACAFEPTEFSGDSTSSPNLDAGNSNNTSANSSTQNANPNATTNNATTNNATTNNATTNNAVTGTDAGPDTRDAGVDFGQDAGEPDMGPTMCDGRIVNLETSNQHCGACANACDRDYGQCRRGECECVDPYGACGDDNRCTDLLVDPNNCGVCGFVCGVGQFCDGGSCSCLPGLTLCGTECVDTNRDPRHCGMCNESCGGNACKDSGCRPNDSCGAFVFECRLDSGGTQCVDDLGSPLNCDANVIDECGDVCEGNELCYRAGLIEPRRCRAYRPARGCVNCPCADCADVGQNCIKLDAYPDKPFCVD
jgi:hypothetical protein